MENINKIIVHYTETEEHRYFDVEDVRSWHKSRGFSDIGYHYLILIDGTVQEGRKESVSGAHTKGHNKNSIGVCYVGGIKLNGELGDTRTTAQKESLISLLKKLKEKYSEATIHGHNEFSKKMCPGFDVQKEYKL